MFKINKKGFALVETLIVTVFVATIFTMMYTNFFPMFGEYERRENYDDIDSIYRTYLLKRMFESEDFKKRINRRYTPNLQYSLYLLIYSANANKNKTCTQLASIENLTDDYTNGDYCKNVMTATQVQNIYLTNYNITELKKNVKQGKILLNQMDSQTQDYIDSLPYYKHNNSNHCQYRIIVEYIKETNELSEVNKKEIYSFSTIGVNLS